MFIHLEKVGGMFEGEFTLNADKIIWVRPDEHDTKRSILMLEEGVKIWVDTPYHVLSQHLTEHPVN